MRRECFFGLALIVSCVFWAASMLSPIEAGSKALAGQPRHARKSQARQQPPTVSCVPATLGGIGPAAGVSPGVVNARSAVLMEVSTGKILFEQNADQLIAPASLTKIMSLYLVFEALRQGRIHLSDQVFISKDAWRTGGSRMFLQVGTRVPLEQIIEGISIVSGNDACVAAAEYLSGSTATFVDAMNVEAQKLGMTHTRFLTVDGLPADGQLTTAGDMAILDRAFIQTFPEALKYTSTKEFKFNNIDQYNRNRLLFQYPDIDGLKTGYVAAGGYHLSATAYRNGMRLLALVMGADSPAIRAKEALKLLNYGYSNFTSVKPFEKNQPVAKVAIWKGQKDEVRLYPAKEASFLILQNQKNLLKWEIDAPADISAPVAANLPIGKIVFTVSGKPERTIDLVSRENVALGSWFKRSRQSIEMSVQTFSWKWLSWLVGGLAIFVILLLLVTGRKSSRI